MTAGAALCLALLHSGDCYVPIVPPTENDLLYNPRLSVAGFQDILASGRRRSQAARARLDAYLDVAYGAGPDAKMDIFRAHGSSRGMLMFIHGGYWRAMDKSDYSYLAQELVHAGMSVALPNHALCPKVTVRDIVMQMVQAAAWLHRNAGNFGAPPDRLYVAGHSAGGHLAAMLLACRWSDYAHDLPAKTVRGALSISGLYDLRALVDAPSINGDVRLDKRGAAAVSPALMQPATDAPLFTTVGSEENQGFHAQDRLIARRWRKVHKHTAACAGAHHFSVLEGLLDPSSDLFRDTIALMEH